jgi:hypothetical protein
MSVSGNKINYAAWLTKLVGEKIIKSEDVYKYKDYFDIFNKFKDEKENHTTVKAWTYHDSHNFQTMILELDT